VQILADQILAELVDGSGVEPVCARGGRSDGDRIEGGGHVALVQQMIRNVEAPFQELQIPAEIPGKK